MQTRSFSPIIRPDIFPELVPEEAIPPEAQGQLSIGWAKALKQKEFVPAVFEGGLRVTALNVLNVHKYGELFITYLRARHETFIQQRRWELPEFQGMEYDQYDTPLSYAIVLHEFGEVLAGMRIMPTTARCGVYSYMIRDAQLGVIDTIPNDLLFMEAPVRDDIWEATRLFVSHRVPAERRIRIQTILMQQSAVVARELGASRIIGIVPAVFPKWLKRIKMSAFPVGPIMNIDGDRTQCAIMNVLDVGI